MDFLRWFKRPSKGLYPEATWTVEYDAGGFRATDQTGKTMFVSDQDLFSIVIETYTAFTNAIGDVSTIFTGGSLASAAFAGWATGFGAGSFDFGSTRATFGCIVVIGAAEFCWASSMGIA